MLWNSEKRVLLYTKKLNSFYLVQHFWRRIRSYIMVLLCENKENNTHTHIHTHTHMFWLLRTPLSRKWFVLHEHETCITIVIIIIISSLTARVVGAPQMILKPVFSIFPCSPLPSGTCRTPGLSIPWCCLPTSSLLLYKIDNLQLMMGLVMRQGWV